MKDKKYKIKFTSDTYPLNTFNIKGEVGTGEKMYFAYGSSQNQTKKAWPGPTLHVNGTFFHFLVKKKEKKKILVIAKEIFFPAMTST